VFRAVLGRWRRRRRRQRLSSGHVISVGLGDSFPLIADLKIHSFLIPSIAAHRTASTAAVANSDSPSQSCQSN
jgi:hypothetical protein